MNVVMTANSPGEVASWLRPMVAAMKARLPEAHIHVCLAPCAYSTGAEEAVVRSIPGVDVVHRPAVTVAWALGGRRPPSLEGKEGFILFLGGDLVYGALLAWRTGWPAAAYTEGRARWTNRFERFYVPHEEARQRALSHGAPAAKVQVTGDLMLDGLTLRWPESERRERLGVPGDSPVLGLFPGSRAHELRRAFPLQLRAAAHVVAERPQVRCIAAISPFVTRQVLTEALEAEGFFSPPPDKLVSALFPEGEDDPGGYPWSHRQHSVTVEWIARDPGTGVGRGEGRKDRTGAGRESSVPIRVQLVRGAPYDVAAASDVVMTIPGSNTAELGGLGVPMVVTIPMQHIEEIPLDGLPGLIGGVPWIGRAVKRRTIARLAQKMPFTAWPNRRAGRAIVPELRKMGLTPLEVAETVIALLDDRLARERMSAELRQVMGEPGASGRIAADCLALMGL